MSASIHLSFIDVAMAAAKQAGNAVLSRASDINTLTIEQKSLHDYVSEVDRDSETLIRTTILNAFPEHRFLGEEFGESEGNADEYQWIVDPLDGTTNFLRGIGHYGISIALQHRGQLICAAIYDPVKDEMFTAEDGGGAACNGRPISVSDRSTMQGGIYATGVPFNGQTLANLECFQNCMAGVLEQHTAGVRRLGSAALDLAYVAAGRYEGYWEANLQPWDIAAGILLVQEAGGVVSALSGAADMLTTGHVLAACPGAYNDLLDICQASYRSWK